MVNVVLTLASKIVPATDRPGMVEAAWTFVYIVEGDTENTQGTLKDNRRAQEIADVVLSNWNGCVKGAPPPDTHPIMSIYISVQNAHGNKSCHTVNYQRHDFHKEYHKAAGNMMDTYRHLFGIFFGNAARLREEKMAKREKRRAEARAILEAAKEAAEHDE